MILKEEYVTSIYFNPGPAEVSETNQIFYPGGDSNCSWDYLLIN